MFCTAETAYDTSCVDDSLPWLTRTRPADGCPERPIGCSFTRLHVSRTPLAIVPYLADLGITDVYASPYLKARPGSWHGYDITDHRPPQSRSRHRGRVRRLGTAPCASSPRACCSTSCRITWPSLATKTPGGTTSSRTGRPHPMPDYFDIAWTASTRPELQGRVLIPILGDPYVKVLESQQLQLELRRRLVLDPLLRPSLSRRSAQLTDLS